MVACGVLALAVAGGLGLWELLVFAALLALSAIPNAITWSTVWAARVRRDGARRDVKDRRRQLAGSMSAVTDG